MPASRRQFLKSAAAISLGFSGLYHHIAWAAPGNPEDRFGPLITDPKGILDLPEGFSYKIISTVGAPMNDGLSVPGNADGMAAFPGPEGRVILIRNHELGPTAKAASAFGENNEWLHKIRKSDVYDWGHGKTPGLGGTSTLVYNMQRGLVEKEFLSLAGTTVNCAGGPTPWHSWITCEENTAQIDQVHQKDHGYNFEVPASSEIGRAAPMPLKAMGRFKHEAVAVDPRTGIVYETEDQDDSLIYRFIPAVPGKLAEGGRLQALTIIDQPSLDTRNWEETLVSPGQQLAARWIDMDEVDSPNEDLRYRGFERGATLFARGEGMWYGHDSIYFACTSGGSLKKGQIFRYRPSPHEATADEHKAPGTLELFIEPNDGDLVDNADTLTVSPFGDLIVCEDGGGGNNLVGVTPEGQLYRFAHNAMNTSEFAGVTFSPDGQVLFVNIQHPGNTFAIYGPWDQHRS